MVTPNVGANGRFGKLNRSGFDVEDAVGETRVQRQARTSRALNSQIVGDDQWTIGNSNRPCHVEVDLIAAGSIGDGLPQRTGTTVRQCGYSDSGGGRLQHENEHEPDDGKPRLIPPAEVLTAGTRLDGAVWMADGVLVHSFGLCGQSAGKLT